MITMDFEEKRIEAAWERLRSWAESLHMISDRGVLFGSGFGPPSDMLFKDVPLDLAIRELNRIWRSSRAMSVAIISRNSKGAPDYKPGTIRRFAINVQRGDDCVLEATTELQVNGGALEVTITVMKVGVNLVDVRARWLPVLEFFNAPNLKDRLTSILRFFFRTQEALSCPRLLMSTQSIQNPRFDKSLWLEL